MHSCCLLSKCCTLNVFRHLHGNKLTGSLPSSLSKLTLQSLWGIESYLLQCLTVVVYKYMKLALSPDCRSIPLWYLWMCSCHAFFSSLCLNWFQFFLPSFHECIQILRFDFFRYLKSNYLKGSLQPIDKLCSKSPSKPRYHISYNCFRTSSAHCSIGTQRSAKECSNVGKT